MHGYLLAQAPRAALRKDGVKRGALPAEQSHTGGLSAAPALRHAEPLGAGGTGHAAWTLPCRSREESPSGLEGTGRNALLKAYRVPPPPRHQEPQKSRPGTGTAPRAAALRFPRGRATFQLLGWCAGICSALSPARAVGIC